MIICLSKMKNTFSCNKYLLVVINLTQTSVIVQIHIITEDLTMCCRFCQGIGSRAVVCS